MLLILAYCLNPYPRTALSSIRFSHIGYVFLITHLILSCSMEFYVYASHSISTVPHFREGDSMSLAHLVESGHNFICVGGVNGGVNGEIGLHSLDPSYGVGRFS